MNTLDIEIAMMKKLNVRKNIIVPNVSWGINIKNHKPLHECDLLMLSSAGYATEIEIKISKADLLKDKEKSHGHNHRLIKHLYFAVPESLKEIALKEIPNNAGLYTLSYNQSKRIVVKKIREGFPRKDALKWEEKVQKKLLHLGVMRLVRLKERVNRG